jgi:hypothetical protein
MHACDAAATFSVLSELRMSYSECRQTHRLIGLKPPAFELALSPKADRQMSTERANQNSRKQSAYCSSNVAAAGDIDWDLFTRIH